MRKTDNQAAATPTIQVIERMFALIDVLASREEAMTLKEISEKTGLHPSTTHRILNDLATGRFVDREEAKIVGEESGQTGRKCTWRGSLLDAGDDPGVRLRAA